MRALALLLLLLLLPISLFAANGAADIGVGGISKGMGGVGIALPQDAFASAMNPAGLICVGNRVDLDLGVTAQKGSQRVYILATGATNPERSGKDDNQALWWPGAAASLRYCDTQSVGIAVFVKNALATKVPFRLYLNPGNTVPSRFAAYTLYITPSWSWALSSCISVGIAVNGTIQLHTNNVAFSQSDTSIAPNQPVGNFLGRNTLDVAGGTSVRGGLLYRPLRGLNVGITAQTPPLMSKLRKYGGQWPNGAMWETPAEIGAGISYCHRDARDGVRMSVEWLYYFWEDSLIWGNSYRESQDDTGGFRWLTGSALGAGFGWKNQTVWKVGISWNPWEVSWLTVRCGYNYGSVPIVGDETLLNQMAKATIQHHATLGATARICCFEVTLYYYHGFESTVKGRGPYYVPSNSTADISNQQNTAGISVGACW